eukprot:s1838_g13.t1
MNGQTFEKETTQLRCRDLQGDLHAGYARSPVTCSFTDEFLNFLRERSQAQEAAVQLAAEDDELDQMLGDAGDLQLDTPGDLSILAHRGGDRRFRFYRPDPFALGRPLSLSFHALPASTVDDIRQAIIRAWPDLAVPGSLWTILEIHESVANSIQAEPDTELYMVHVLRDLAPGEVTVMQEYQMWSLREKEFDAILRPVVLPNLIRGKMLMHERTEGHACFYRPCMAARNGEILQVDDEYDLHSADYVTVMALTSVEGILDAIGHWTDSMGQEAFHTDAFPRLTGVVMALGTEIPTQKGRTNARILQVALSTTYRHLYGQYQGHQVGRGHLLGITLAGDYVPDEIHPVSMTELQVGREHSREFPWMLEGFIRAAMLKDSWAGTFVLPRRGIFQLSLPETLNPIDQVLVIRPWTAPSILSLVIVEIRVDGPLRGTQAFREQEMVIVFTAGRCTRDAMLRYMHMGVDCQQAECLFSLNDRMMTEANEVHQVPEGSILRIWYSVYGQSSESPEPIEGAVISHQGHDAQGAGTQYITSTHQSTGSSADPQYVPGTFLQNLVAAFLFFHSWSPWKQWGGFCKCSSRNLKHKRRPSSVPRRFRWGSSWAMKIALYVVMIHVGMALTVRVGEAKHPGPEFCLGTVNPSGASGKEGILAQLPYGVWGITETHLSGINQKPVIRNIRRAAPHRDLHCLPGAPVALRARSTSAGVWAGVMNFSDLVMRNINCLDTKNEFNLGRLQILQYFCGPFQMTGATLYGWAKSPTWPNSVRDTNHLLNQVVKELGMSRGGPRFIMGDLNHELPALEGWATLQAEGWVDIQDYAAEHWNREHTMTFRQATITDHILVSPELIPFLQRVQTWDWFSDHSALGVLLDVPTLQMKQQTWPLPAQIPWDDVDYDVWRHMEHRISGQHLQDLDERLQCFAEDYEASFQDCMKHHLAALPQGCKGRCKRTAPVSRDAAAPLLKESRPGEVSMRSDCLNRETQRWFQQLRRLQSMTHALKAGKETPEAVEYRASLWRSIRKAKGFQESFEEWWLTCPTKHAALPHRFPTGTTRG